MYVSTYLFIEAGTTIYSVSADDTDDGLAPALIIEPGAQIVAEGTATAPITFTTNYKDVGTTRGLWGSAGARGSRGCSRRVPRSGGFSPTRARLPAAPEASHEGPQQLAVFHFTLFPAEF